MVQTAVPADLDFASDVDAKGVGELEGMEEGVGNDCRSLIHCFGFEESEMEYAKMLIIRANANDLRVLVQRK